MLASQVSEGWDRYRLAGQSIKGDSGNPPYLEKGDVRMDKKSREETASCESEQGEGLGPQGCMGIGGIQASSSSPDVLRACQQINCLLLIDSNSASPHSQGPGPPSSLLRKQLR